MAFIPTLNAIKVSIIGSIAGQQVVIDITIGTPAAPTISDLNSATTAIHSWLDTELLPTLTNAYSFNEIKAYDLSSVTAPVVSLPISSVGTQAVPPVPNNVALVTSFLTGGRGRSSRGRNYLAGLANNSGTPVSVVPATAAAVATAWSHLPTYLGPVSQEHVVISNHHLGAPRPAGLKQTVTAYRTNIDYDSQRRRLNGRGA